MNGVQSKRHDHVEHAQRKDEIHGWSGWVGLVGSCVLSANQPKTQALHAGVKDTLCGTAVGPSVIIVTLCPRGLRKRKLCAFAAVVRVGMRGGGGYNHRDSAVNALYQLLCVPAATPMGVYEGNTLGSPLLAM